MEPWWWEIFSVDEAIIVGEGVSTVELMEWSIDVDCESKESYILGNKISEKKLPKQVTGNDPGLKQ